MEVCVGVCVCVCVCSHACVKQWMQNMFALIKSKQGILTMQFLTQLFSNVRQFFANFAKLKKITEPLISDFANGIHPIYRCQHFFKKAFYLAGKDDLKQVITSLD